MSEGEPRDPFADEVGGAWHQTFRTGEMVFRALAELPSATDAIIAIKKMSRGDLEAFALERLYDWHIKKDGPPYLSPHEWLYPPEGGDVS
jgi:hypothetical protein